MADTKEGKRIFTVARVFFLLIVIPLLLTVFLISTSIIQLGGTSKRGAITVLDRKSKEEILTRATAVAENVADFIEERKRDMLISTILPTTAAAYKEFIDKNKQALWVKKNGNIVKVFEPLYVEMSLIDKTGKEIIKIADGRVEPKAKLVNVRDPENTTYKSEDYFSKAKNLNKGEVYISRVTGWYVNKADFEKGGRFKGIIRLATPLFNKDGFAGTITLALDARYLAKFTDTIIPTQAGHILEADASTGNYTYMVDNQGFVISHPNDYHIAGLYKDGTPVPPLRDEIVDEMTKKGEEVLNLNLLGSMDPGLPEVAKDAAAGHSGIKTYKFGGHTKVVAYSPIQFYSKDFPAPAGFGWVGMGIDVDKFNEQATETSQQIEKEAQTWITTVVLILIIAIVLLFIISAILAKGINRSIEAEVPPEAEEAGRHYDDEVQEDQ
ncbi:MAG: cache domain-containing protein [Thermodesulfobacteriota bacterium]|nr:cache domain-containing protein [Thermodesulfobacteriota bacterium]